MTKKDDYCRCCRGDSPKKGCRGSKCGPQYPWGVKKKNGEAVLKAIVALQRSELQKELPSHASPCASGTWHNGKALLKAIRARHRNACANFKPEIYAVPPMAGQRRSVSNDWKRYNLIMGREDA